MAKRKLSQKRVVKAQSRLRRLEETIAPFKKVPSPQTPRPKSEWVPGDFTSIRRDDAREQHDHPHLLVIE